MLFFFFNDTATTEIYTLSLHDALPILERAGEEILLHVGGADAALRPDFDRPAMRGPTFVHYSALHPLVQRDRKSTRLNSSHSQISYAVFCLKKKKKKTLEIL